MNLLMSSGFET